MRPTEIMPLLVHRLRDGRLMAALRLLLLFGVLFAVVSDASVSAAEPGTVSVAEPKTEEDVQGTEDQWEFLVVPYVWFLQVDGNATVKGITVPVDSSFSDIWSKLNIAIMGQLEVRKGSFGLYINPLYAKLESDSSVGPIRVNSTGKLSIVDFAAFYRVGQWSFGTEAEAGYPKYAFEPYFGGRVMSLRGEFDFKRLPGVEQSKAWVDPIFGFRNILDFTDRWNLIAQADIGGFEANSHLTGQTMLLLGYRFGMFGDKNANLLLGYRGLYTDYSQGSGRDAFAVKTWLYGPILGLAVRF